MEEQLRLDAQDVVDDLMGGEEPDYTSEPSAPLADDEKRATALLYRRRRLMKEIERAAAIYEEQIEFLQARMSEHLDPLAAQVVWLEESLILWHHARWQRDNRETTIKLPSGTLASSKAQDQWQYTDEGAFLEWAHDNAQSAVRPPKPGEETIDKTKAKEALADVIELNGVIPVIKETGEVVPGLAIRKGGSFEFGRKYTIKEN